MMYALLALSAKSPLTHYELGELQRVNQYSLES